MSSERALSPAELGLVTRKRGMASKWLNMYELSAVTGIDIEFLQTSAEVRVARFMRTRQQVIRHYGIRVYAQTRLAHRRKKEKKEPQPQRRAVPESWKTRKRVFAPCKTFLKLGV